MGASEEKTEQPCDCCYCRHQREVERMRKLRLRQRLASKGERECRESEDA